MTNTNNLFIEELKDNRSSYNNLFINTRDEVFTIIKLTSDDHVDFSSDLDFFSSVPEKDLEELKLLYLSKNGKITLVNSLIKEVPNEEKRDLNINLFEQSQNNVSLNAEDTNILSTIEDGKYGLKFDFKINDKHFESQLRFDSANPTDATRILPELYAESLRCTYLSPKFDFNASIQGLKNILQNKDESFIVDGLKLIEPRVKDFIFTDNEMLVDAGLSKRIPVNMMGDGARKIVSLLTAVYDCKDGILLIDEISNGFHYSVMRSLWKVLINASIKNNTQLFVTTHDVDSIKGLRDAALENYKDIVATFKLLKTNDDELKAYHYSLESLDYSINQEIEVR